MLHLRIALEKDLKIISGLAHTIWNEHYVPIIGQKQVDYMLDKIYNLKSLLEQLHEKKHIFYIIEKEEIAIGFISISSNNASDYFLHKFYINQRLSNAGIGTQCLDLLIKLIKPKLLILNVNRENFKSINFYFKNGFKIEHLEDLDIGNGYVMNDFVMVKKL